LRSEEGLGERFKEIDPYPWLSVPDSVQNPPLSQLSRLD